MISPLGLSPSSVPNKIFLFVLILGFVSLGFSLSFAVLCFKIKFNICLYLPASCQ